MLKFVMCDVYYQIIIYNNTKIANLRSSLQHCPYNRINVNRLTPLAPFTANAASELDVLGHDGDTLGVDGAEVGVFEEADEISPGSMLQGEDSG